MKDDDNKRKAAELQAARDLEQLTREEEQRARLEAARLAERLGFGPGKK